MPVRMVVAGERGWSEISAEQVHHLAAELPKRAAARQHHKHENQHVDAGEDGGGWKLTQRAGVHSHSRTTGGASGTAVAQDRSHSFFIYRQFSAALEALRHENRINEGIAKTHGKPGQVAKIAKIAGIG